MSRPLEVLALAPYCDGNDVGEAWCAHQWVKNLAEQANVTLLTLQRPGRATASEQLPDVKVVAWAERYAPQPFDRITSMLKPSYINFYTQARRWIKDTLASGRRFDIAHQFSPVALRYPSPLSDFSIPYVIGPQGGSLDTPAGFVAECQTSAWYTRLRRLDHWRLRNDPALRRTYKNAAAVLGVAPYVGELIAPTSPRRFEVISELGIYDLAPRNPRLQSHDALRLLHVGRAVRTKGLRDSVRALAMLSDDLLFHLDVAGQGEELVLCQREAARLGVADKITFHGQVARSEVEHLYLRADAFLFPSFREPSGSVIFEAMRHALPVITTNRGGPGFVVDDSCGIRVPALTPEQLARDLATGISRIARDSTLLERLSTGAHERIRQIGLWDGKIHWLLNLYDELIDAAAHTDLKEVV
jgi:glycosyltransferase involved in cell wall biosynthesis